MLLILLLAAAPPHLAAPPRHAADPPVEMVDFLGRRRECARLDGDAEDPDWDWYACGRLAAEEAALRARFAGDGGAIGWLDEAPERFDLERILVSSDDGPPPARVGRIEQSGTDWSGAVAYRATLDDRGAHAASVTFSVSGGPERTIWLDRRRFPRLDPQSMRVGAARRGGGWTLRIAVRYGVRRGWCGDLDWDDRPQAAIYYGPEARLLVHRGDRTNCAPTGEELEPAAYLAPPR